MDFKLKQINNAFSISNYAFPEAKYNHQLILKISQFDTLLSSMVSISDDNGLYMLDFKNKINKLAIKNKAKIISEDNNLTRMIKKELDLYFAGKLTIFKTPLHLTGSDFQKNAWNTLKHIFYGQTKSYLEQAKITGNEKAFRAIANANAANFLAIVIPDHKS